MKKLYIATTTLNFNNILSTESISPKSFYEKRKFGYKRFELVEPSIYQNTIIAYSKIPRFEINDKELDNYPLIVEISKDLAGEITRIDRIEGIDIYQISKTIYLHPTKTRLLFFADEHKKIALIKSESSIETKLLPLYRDTLCILATEKHNTFSWQKSYLKNIKEQENSNIRKFIFLDEQINSIKGFYYCYILGDIYSTFKQQSQIDEMLRVNELERKKAIANNDYKKIKEINNAENRELGKIVNKKIEPYSNINISNYKVTSFTNNKKPTIAELYKNIINDSMTYSIVHRINNGEEFKLEKFEILKVIGNNFKEVLDKDLKEKEEIINYIRAIMENIKNYKTLDINQISRNEYSTLLKSIAHFILKGDDLEKLLNTLKENNCPTFKIAFGLWGAIFGFSAIPKTISDTLFESNTKAFFSVQEFLKDTYKKIHNIDVDENISIVNKEQKNMEQETKKEKIEHISNQNQNQNSSLKCPKCGSDMTLREPKNNKNWKKGYGCSKYKNDKSGCDGWVDYEEYHSDSSQVSSISKTTDQNSNSVVLVSSAKDKIFNYLREKDPSKINDVIKSVCKDDGRKFETNKEFKEFIEDDARFELIKLGKADGVKVKNETV